jgi:ABC-type antimicrobial peptide transport system permease subunit
MQRLWQDLRYGLRMLGKNPGFTSTAVITVALGVGATTAIFSVVYGVLLRPLPYQHPDQIVRLWEQSDTGVHLNFADPNFEDVREQNRSLEGMAEYNALLETVSGAKEPTRTMISYVSRDFFQVLGIQPLLGREFAPEEQRFDASLVALVSYPYWKQSLGATQELSSVRLRIGDRAASIIGVMPAGFRFPGDADLWLPREVLERLPSRSAHNWNVIGRLRKDVAPDGARTELSAIAQRLKQQYGPDTAMVAVAMEPLRRAMTGEVRPALLILLGASGFLLLIACANVTNLMLAQAARREGELSIRMALGAQRSRLIAQLLTEAFLLSFIGGGLGVFLAYWGLNALLAMAPANLPRIENVSINLPVLLFSLGMVFLVSIALGMFPAFRTASADPRAALSDGSRGEVSTPRKQQLGRLLTAGQLATALVLLVGAGLLGRSLLRVLATDSGFRIEGVVTMELGLPDDPERTQRVPFLTELMTKLRQVPGVEEVGGTTDLPLAGSAPSDGAYVVMNPGQISPRMQALIKKTTNGSLGNDPVLLGEFTKFFEELFRDQTHMGEADYSVASEGYFKALGIPLLQGRLFDGRDAADAPHAALISESLAKEKWPNQDPLGRTIEFGNMDGDPRVLTVVGVVGDVRDRAVETVPRPTIYVNYRQRPQVVRQFYVVMRTSGRPDAVISAAHGILRNLDPNMPPRFRALSEIFSASLEARRFSLILVGIFSLTALVLALTGIYGVTAYAVAQRTREIGVRMALGASRQGILGMVLKQGAITGAIGVGLGVVGALALTRWMQSQLFGVSATDPATFLGVALLLILVSLIACWIPGRLAARVDPMVALRYE